MSLIKLQGNASGTGAFTIAAPNSNTDRTLTLPDATGTVVTADGSGNIATTSITPSSGIYLGGSGSANLLDDYEEGTWTPVAQGGTNPTVTYSDRYGYYTKIGRLVNIYGRLQIGTISGGSGYFFVGGLPFAVNSSAGRYATGSMGYSAGWATITPLVLIAPHNTSRFEMYGSTGTSARDSMSAIISISNAQAGSDIIFALSYETT